MSDYNVVKASAWGRDPIRELKAACDRSWRTTSLPPIARALAVPLGLLVESLTVSGQTVRGAVEAGKELTLPLAKVHRTAGSHTMAITPVRIVGAELMRLRTVTLTPVGQWISSAGTPMVAAPREPIARERATSMPKRERPARRVSQQDIAREANVSRVTVSLVLAGKDQTSEETRKRVLEAAKRLRYRPNLLVQGMQTGRTGSIGVIMPVSMHFHTQIAKGVHDELVAADFVPIQLWTNPRTHTKEAELEQIHRLIDRRVDGMIIFPIDASVPDVHFQEIWQREIPLVTVDRETTTHADHVGTDEESGGRMAAEHLLSLGHRHVIHLTPSRTGNFLRRGQSFAKTMEKAGATVDMVVAPSDEMAGPLREALSRSPRPTAVFAALDPIAIKAYSAAAELGLKIPQDLSIVGYADFPFATDLPPPLTTVKQDPYQMGRQAAQVLLDRILGRSTSTAPHHYHFTPEMVVRQSTGPAARS